jgi:LysM repeat protein
MIALVCIYQGFQEEIPPVCSLFGGTPLYRLLGLPLSRSASLSTLTKRSSIGILLLVPKRKNTSGWERERECVRIRLLASSLTLLLTALLLSSCSTDEQYRSLPEVVQVERVVPYHIVSGGESVGTIAEKYSMTRTELIKLNGLSPPYQLYSGQRLVINVKVEDSSSTQADSDVVVVEEKTKPEKKEQAGDEIERPKLENEQPIQEQESDAPQIVEEESSDYVWPIADGQNKIIQNFNDSSDGEVILKASAGTPVKAVTDGTVRIAKTLDG